MSQQMSGTTVLGNLGYVWKKEQKQIADEAKYTAELAARTQEEQQNAGFAQQIARGQAAGGQGQGGGGDASQGAGAGGGGGQSPMLGVGGPLQGPVTQYLASVGPNTPVSVQDMQQVAQSLAQELLSGLPESVKNSELRKLKQYNNALHDLVIGILRSSGEAPSGKKPLLIGDLRNMIDALPKTIQGVRDRALLLLGFAGGLRRHELVALDVEDLEEVEEGLVINLRRSKTDQTGKGLKKGIPFGKSLKTCPVLAVVTWLRAAEVFEGPVFRGVTKHRSVQMVRRYIRDASLFRDNPATKTGL